MHISCEHITCLFSADMHVYVSRSDIDLYQVSLQEVPQCHMQFKSNRTVHTCDNFCN